MTTVSYVARGIVLSAAIIVSFFTECMFGLIIEHRYMEDDR